MRAAAGLTCLMLLAGCVPVIPHHDPASRANVPQALPDWLEPGHSSLAEVLLRLGEPDLVAEQDRSLAWISVDRLGGGLLLVPTGAIGAAADHTRRLLVRFGTDGRVTDRSLDSAVCAAGLFGGGNFGRDFGGECLPPITGTDRPAAR